MALVRIDISEERIASIISLEGISELGPTVEERFSKLGTTTKEESASRYNCKERMNVSVLSFLKVEAICSS
jgi:hypothetical protein